MSNSHNVLYLKPTRPNLGISNAIVELGSFPKVMEGHRTKLYFAHGVVKSHVRKEHYTRNKV